MQQYENLSREMKQTLNSEKFIMWLIQDLPPKGLAEIVTLLDGQLKGKDPTKMPRQMYENILKRLSESFLMRVLTVPSIITPLVKALPKEQLHKLDQTSMTREVIQTLVQANEVSASQQALLYITHNYFDEAYQLYIKEPILPAVKEDAALRQKIKELERSQEVERKAWKKQATSLKQQKEREQKKLADKINALQIAYAEAKAQVATLTTTLTEAEAQQIAQQQQVADLEEKLTAHNSNENTLKQAPKVNTVVREPVATILGFVEPYFPSRSDASIFLTSNSELQFMIKPLSSPYQGFPLEEITKFTSWQKYLPADFSDIGDTKQERCQNLYDYFKGNLLLFNAQRTKTNNGDFRWEATSIQLVPRALSFAPTDFYEAIPIFSEAPSFSNFLKCLQTRSFIGRIKHIEPKDTPPIIFYQRDAALHFVGLFTNHYYAHGGFKFDVTEDSTLYYGEVPASIVENMYYCDDVAFVEQRQVKALYDAIHQKNTAIEVKTYNGALADEEAFLSRWRSEIDAMQLAYAPIDLHNFHTCMKTGGLTILAGMSGTGKSQLVQSYRRSLGLTEEQFLFIPVSPSWTDEADILGYFDIEKGRYEPSPTGIIDMLVRATNHPNETHIICFDEMNLARIEHYFSPFLSLLELTGEERKLTLYHTLYKKQDARYPAQLTIGHNVVFVGTINLDESTHQLSDKALDRANLLTLHVLPFHTLFEVKPIPALTHVLKPVALHAFSDSTTTMTLTERQLQFLWDVHQLLQQTSTHSGVGPRIVAQINQYMKNSDANSLRPAVAFDLQVVQRILPKLRGTAASIETLVAQDGQLIALCDMYHDISDFAHVRAVLATKERELAQHGYAF